MNFLNYKNEVLYLEDVSLESIAVNVGTPTYIYSEAKLIENYNLFNFALEDKLGKGFKKLIAYSVKSNSNIAVINTLQKLGSGADVVSAGELKRALKAGIKGENIVFSGVGKTLEEIEFAIGKNINQFNVESMEELKLLSEVASSKNYKAPVALRINPDIHAGGHEKISTGGSDTKFGIPYQESMGVYEFAKSLPGINVIGIDIHIGSQITSLKPFQLAFEKILELYKNLINLGYKIENIDLGGGIGVAYGNEKTLFSLDDYADLVKNIFKGVDSKLIFEPGRCISASAGILLSKIIRRKSSYNNNFLIIDAAMNDFIRPTLYDAFHSIKTLKNYDNYKEKINYKIVGPICETGDVLGNLVSSNILSSGDFIIIKDVGAYGSVMSSNYNSRPLIPEVMVNGNAFNIIRKKITVEDFISFENIPS